VRDFTKKYVPMMAVNQRAAIFHRLRAREEYSRLRSDCRDISVVDISSFYGVVVVELKLVGAKYRFILGEQVKENDGQWAKTKKSR
jgi:hypothetical protein